MEIKLVSIKLEMIVHLICVKLVCFSKPVEQANIATNYYDTA